MDATTTPLTSLLKKLRQDYPDILFSEGEQFMWSPDSKTVFYVKNGSQELLIHEVSHGILRHKGYEKDVQLVAMERLAWDKAVDLADKYGVNVKVDTIEDHLDTYRDWLHARSVCPNCTATGYQSGKSTYSCPACLQDWTVNEARVCQLKRTKVKSI